MSLYKNHLSIQPEGDTDRQPENILSESIMKIMPSVINYSHSFDFKTSRTNSNILS